jgi:hypothetical protein
MCDTVVVARGTSFKKNEYHFYSTGKVKKKVKQSLYTPWRRLGGEDV